MADSTAEGRTLFFYGTLMTTAVLHRVCHITPHAPRSPPVIHEPALLRQHRRHRVRGCDYPAIVPCATSSVRGALVRGLTDADVKRLDAFEGDEYERRAVQVEVLGEGQNVLEGTAQEDRQGEMVPVEAYIWIESQAALEDEEWDFDEFVRDKLSRWAGTAGQREYADSDAVRVDPANDPTRGRGVHVVV